MELETKPIAPGEPREEAAAHLTEVLCERLRNPFFVFFRFYIDDILRSKGGKFEDKKDE